MSILTTTEVAALLDEDERTVQRKARAGTYPAIKLPGATGAYVFAADDVAALVAAKAAA